jgi:hypothetical protein
MKASSVIRRHEHSRSSRVLAQVLRNISISVINRTPIRSCKSFSLFRSAGHSVIPSKNKEYSPLEGSYCILRKRAVTLAFRNESSYVELFSINITISLLCGSRIIALRMGTERTSDCSTFRPLTTDRTEAIEHFHRRCNGS